MNFKRPFPDDDWRLLPASVHDYVEDLERNVSHYTEKVSELSGRSMHIHTKRPDVKKYFSIKLVLFTTMVFSLIVWGIFGFFVYIPMLSRIVMIYCFRVFVSIFQEIDIDAVQRKLEYVAHLYSKKFEEIVNSFQFHRSKETSLPRLKPIDWKGLLKVAYVDIVWGLLVWGIFIWISIYFFY